MAGTGGPSEPDGAPNTDQPPGLRCADCGRRYDAGPAEPWRCDCGGPLELDARVQLPPDPAALDRRAGLWAFADLLPVAPRVTLGEGWTPLVDAPGWDARFKLEYVHPTGSFKDRGATTTLSRAAALGVGRVVEDSSGNAGAAVATYAARAGIDAEIFVPADAKPAKVAAIERAGADVVRVEGSRGDVTDACVAAAEAGHGWYASHAAHPAFLAGTSTFALEVAADRGWSVPDAVVLPVGHGTLLLGAYRGFRALADAGWTEGVPRLLAAQAAGCAPVVDAVADGLEGGGPADGDDTQGEDDDTQGEDDDTQGEDDDTQGEDDDTDDNAVADGVRVREPARRGQILDAIAETGGDAVAVGGAATRAELDRLRRAGFYVEPTGALAPAALPAFRERGIVDADDDVVVPLTGSGLKDVPGGE